MNDVQVLLEQMTTDTSNQALQQEDVSLRLMLNTILKSEAGK